MKIVRPGNTEFNLILAQFCETYCNLNPIEMNEVHTIKKCYTDWLYKTSGYYDKNITKKDKYDFSIDYTDKLKEYIKKMTESLRESDMVCCLGLEWMINHNHPFLKYIPQMESTFNIKLLPRNIDTRFTIPHIIHKKVLVISPFKEIIDTQISSGNLNKIQPTLQNSEFITFKFPYTFLNNGPHMDSFETLKGIEDDIQNNYNDFDIAILSCGSYGTFLADFINKELKKDVIYVGGQLPLLFGIIGKRDKWAINELYNKDTTYLIDGIPEEFRPDGWKQIEDGCYW